MGQDPKANALRKGQCLAQFPFCKALAFGRRSLTCTEGFYATTSAHRPNCQASQTRPRPPRRNRTRRHSVDPAGGGAGAVPVGLRYKTSRLSGRRLTAATADKYRSWLTRFEKWLVEAGLPLDLGALTDDDFRQMQADVLDDIDDGRLQESSAATYVRAIKTLFADTWERLELEPAANPILKLRAGTQQAVDFPLFKPEHVQALLRATMRTRPGNIAPWIAYRDQALLACFFDLGWRVGEASQARLEDVDLRAGYVTIPRENVKDGDRLPPNAIRKMFRRLARAGGIPAEAARVSPHTCRHYFAVQWARHHPGDLAGLQRVMGHSSVRTTQIYFERAEDLGAVERQQSMPSNWR
jgi:site-specific recombinase XerD